MAIKLTPLATGAVGISTAGAGAFVAWLVGSWHGGIPDAAAGFMGACLLTALHVIMIKLGADPEEIDATSSAPGQTEVVAKK